MNRKVWMFLICWVCVFACVIPVFADNAIPRIVDRANLLTTEEEVALEEAASQFRKEYALDLVILTVDNLGGKPIADFSDDYYDTMGYGVDSEDSGLILVVSMAERELYISTCGEAIARLSDSELDSIIDHTAQLLGAAEYAEAFEVFLGFTALNLDYDHNNLDPQEKSAVNWILSVFLGAAAAGITILVMRSTMNTKRAKNSANDYLKSDSYDLYRMQDIFLYSNISKVRRQQNSSSGTSVHRSSGGTMHGGRGGKF